MTGRSSMFDEPGCFAFIRARMEEVARENLAAFREPEEAIEEVRAGGYHWRLDHAAKTAWLVAPSYWEAFGGNVFRTHPESAKFRIVPEPGAIPDGFRVVDPPPAG